jgi:putative tryptophan/tyrosine transport system substrate-binding protein
MMQRRDFIAGLGSAAAWPIAVHAQQRALAPVIGFLAPGTADTTRFAIERFIAD